MAQKYIVQLVDDLTNETIDDGAGETVTFSLDGVSYAIDLTTAHADAMRDALGQYVNAARKAEAAPRQRGTAQRATSSAPKPDLKAVREWASENGYEVSTRGRIPSTVQEAYAAAH